MSPLQENGFSESSPPVSVLHSAKAKSLISFLHLVLCLSGIVQLGWHCYFSCLFVVSYDKVNIIICTVISIFSTFAFSRTHVAPLLTLHVALAIVLWYFLCAPWFFPECFARQQASIFRIIITSDASIHTKNILVRFIFPFPMFPFISGRLIIIVSITFMLLTFILYNLYIY